MTGAGSGMGRSISLLLARQGANVGLLDLRAPDAVAREIEDAGEGNCLASACNVQSAEQVSTATKAISKHFGGLHGKW